MKLGEFRARLDIYTRGDIRSPELSELKELMSDVACEIHRAITPLEKIEIDRKNFEVDYDIDDRYFVRKFEEISDDSCEVDFSDEMLIKALMCGVALKRGFDEKFKARYQRDLAKALMEYELNNFDERSYSLKEALRLKGWAKPYEISSAMDNYYIWDEEFIKNLDYYLANIPKTRGLCYERFIRLFVGYQNNLMPEREDLKELDRYMKNRIRMG